MNHISRLLSQTGVYEHIVVNDDVDRAYGVLKDLIVEGTAKGDSLPEGLAP